MVSDERFAHFFQPDINLKMTDRRPGGRGTWYICKLCRRAFPRYMADARSWREGGFRVGAVCKHCLEAKVPDAKYVSLVEYAKGQIAIIKKLADYYNQPYNIEENTKALVESMKSTWDQPEEDVPPERTAEELEIMLSKGECTIAYANAPRDVRAMCRLCINESCPGPYLLGDWEKSKDENVPCQVERAMKLAQKTKPKHLKITKKEARRRSLTRKDAALLLESIKSKEDRNEMQSPELLELRKSLEMFLSQ